MTVIAWDGKIIAADKQASRNGLVRSTTKLTKTIFEKPHGRGEIEYIAGFSGTEQTGLIMLSWFENGARKEDFPETQRDKNTEGNYWSEFIAVNKDGLKYYTLWHVPLHISEKLFAIGTGDELALGAMAAGASAIKAVEIACEWDKDCGRGIDAYDIETMKKVM